MGTIRSSTTVKMRAPKGLRSNLKANAARPLQFWEYQMMAWRGRGVARRCQGVALFRKQPIWVFSTREKVGRDAMTWLQFANSKGYQCDKIGGDSKFVPMKNPLCAHLLHKKAPTFELRNKLRTHQEYSGPGTMNTELCILRIRSCHFVASTLSWM